MALVLAPNGVSSDGNIWAYTPVQGGFVKSYNTPSCHVYATGGGWVASTTSTTLIFNTVIYNTGNCYNTSTGTFTCPVAGRYRVDVSLLTGNSGYTYWSIFRNGVELSSLFHQNRGASWNNTGNYVVAYCAANDTLQCRYWTGTTAAVYTAGDYSQMMVTMV